VKLLPIKAFFDNESNKAFDEQESYSAQYWGFFCVAQEINKQKKISHA
jgi:hypothetical protein